MFSVSCRAAIWTFALTFFLPNVGLTQTQGIGQGLLWVAPKSDAPTKPKPANFRAGPIRDQAVTTNTWYSSLVYTQWSGVLHAHPLSFKATENGLEMGVPRKERGPINQLKNWAGASKDSAVVMHRHRADITVSASAFQPQDARLAQIGDWNVSIEMARGTDALRATVLHGSPYAYFRINRGSVQLVLGEDAKLIEPIKQDPISTRKVVQILSIHGQHYAVYAPAGSQFEWRGGGQLFLHLSDGTDFFSIAALPDVEAKTLDLVSRHAFAFVENTRVDWRYDEAKSEVITTYNTVSRAMDAGESQPLVGLYLHQQKALAEGPPMQPQSLPSIRGPIRWLIGSKFETRLPFYGLLPYWPKVTEAAIDEQIRSLLVGDRRRAPAARAQARPHHPRRRAGVGGGGVAVGEARSACCLTSYVAALPLPLPPPLHTHTPTLPPTHTRTLHPTRTHNMTHSRRSCGRHRL